MTMRVAFVGVSGQGWRTYIDAIATSSVGDSGLVAEFIDLPNDALFFGASQMQRLHRSGAVLRFARQLNLRGVLRDRYVRRRLRSSNPDWVHFFDHHLAFGIIGQRYRRRYPQVRFSVSTTGSASARLSELPEFPNRREFGEISTFLRRRAHRELRIFGESEFIACISEYALRTIPPEHSVKSFLSPFCIQPVPDTFDETNRSSRALPRLVFVGSDFRRKGGDRVLKWFMDGAFPPCELEIVTFEPKPKNADSIPGLVWRGPVSNHAVRTEVLPRAAVVLLPSWLDSSPVALIEAAAASVPAVASRMRGIPDIVIDGVTGYTIDPKDDAAFIGAVSRLLVDHELRMTMSSAAREHFLDNFTPAVAFGPLLKHLSAAGS